MSDVATSIAVINVDELLETLEHRKNCAGPSAKVREQNGHTGDAQRARPQRCRLPVDYGGRYPSWGGGGLRRTQTPLATCRVRIQP